MFKDDLKDELNRLKVDEALLNQTRRRVLAAQNITSDGKVAQRTVAPNRNISVFFRRHSVLIAALLMCVVGLSVFIAVLSSGLLDQAKSSESTNSARDVDHNATTEATYAGEAEGVLFDSQDNHESFKSNAQEDACILTTDVPAPEMQSDAGSPTDSSLRNSLSIASVEQEIVFMNTLPESSISVTICEYIDSDADARADTTSGEPNLPIIEIVISDVTGVDAPVLLSSYWVPGRFDAAVIVDDYLYVSTLSSPLSSEAYEESMLQYAIDGFPWQNIETVIELSDTQQSSAIIGSIHLHDAQLPPSDAYPPFFVAVTGGLLDIVVGELNIVIRDSANIAAETEDDAIVSFRTLPTLDRISP